MNKKYSSEQLNAMKGFLIILVVLGHSTIANQLIPNLKMAIYLK